MLITIDLETSIYNKGNPFDTRNFIVSAHIKKENEPTFCKFYDDPDFLSCIREHLALATLVVGCNIKFDLHHLRNRGVPIPSGCRVWDTMLAEFILSGQTSPFDSLAKQAERYSLGTKVDEISDYWDKGISTEDIPRYLVESRGNIDVGLTHSVYLRQLTDPRTSTALHRLILLDGLDLVVLADMEFNGFLYNSKGSQAEANSLSEELVLLDEELQRCSPTPINFDSGDDLSCFLYGGTKLEDIYISTPSTYQSGEKKGLNYIRRQFSHTHATTFPRKFIPIKGTELAKSTQEKPFYSSAEDVLLQLKASTKEQRHIIKLLNRRGFLTKLVGTYLSALPKLIEEMHWKDNYIHGQFNQVVARTGRLSSSKPNMQNSAPEADRFFISRYDLS